MSKYILYKQSKEIGSIRIERSFFNMNGWEVCSIDSVVFPELVSNNIKYIELTRDDILGFKLFGEPRTISKVAIDDEEEQEYIPLSIESERKIIEITEHRYNCILNAMKKFAVILLEEEFDSRLRKLYLNFSEVETSTWQFQLDEIKQVEEGKNSEFLNSLASSKNITVEGLISKIKEAKENYDNQVKDLFVKLSSLKTEFYSQTDIQETSLLYYKYFGVSCPFSKEFKDKHPEIFNERGEYIEQFISGYYF